MWGVSARALVSRNTDGSRGFHLLPQEALHTSLDCVAYCTVDSQTGEGWAPLANLDQEPIDLMNLRFEPPPAWT